MPLTNTDFEKRDLSELKSICNYKLEELERFSRGFNKNVKIIDSISETRNACDRLKIFKNLAFDCEGVRLGKGGKLTLIQLMANDDDIFIFDVLELGKALFENGMQEILESTEITKVMYDCRGDSDSLWEEYKVKLSNVLDMQLFEFMVRPIAGTNLRGPSKPWHYRKPMIRGLDNTVKTYVVYGQLQQKGIRNFESIKRCGGEIMKTCRTVWRYRPICDALKRYAALDVEMIYLVKDSLSKRKSLQGIELEKLKFASERYVSVRRDHEKPDDLYIRHAILISQIFPEVVGGVVQPFPKGDTKCNGCLRIFVRSFVERGKCGDCKEIDRAAAYRS